MTRLIDADALLEELKSFLSYSTKLLKNHGYSDAVEFVESYHSDMEILITNAPTVQREGWVSVPRKLPYDEMRQVIVDYFDELKDGRRVLIEDFWNELLSAAPTDTE